MSAHPEITDHLSAYADGELDDAQRAIVDAHLPSCEPCRAVLEAITATLADLGALPEVDYTDKDRWALRAALAAERKREAKGPRIVRWIGASSGVAAVIAGLLVFSLGQPDDRGAGDGGAGGPASVAMEMAPQTSGADYDPATANARLEEIAEATRSSKSAAGSQPGASTFSADDAAGTQARNSACQQQLEASFPGPRTLVHAEAARFEGRAAFLLVYQDDDGYTLWISALDDCSLLYSAAAGR